MNRPSARHVPPERTSFGQWTMDPCTAREAVEYGPVDGIVPGRRTPAGPAGGR
ncbi:hypothetical protein [Streptomyces maremycinicus]|uniref:hypothetical protein n=1 Tax=Streptomyces maremycinicus TaxID=1679753 RepID=UPI000AA539BB|nr:hypothetical protein [Streptomyces sp. NBRC 110468]